MTRPGIEPGFPRPRFYSERETISRKNIIVSYIYIYRERERDTERERVREIERMKGIR